MTETFLYRLLWNPAFVYWILFNDVHVLFQSPFVITTRGWAKLSVIMTPRSSREELWLEIPKISPKLQKLIRLELMWMLHKSSSVALFHNERQDGLDNFFFDGFDELDWAQYIGTVVKVVIWSGASLASWKQIEK